MQINSTSGIGRLLFGYIIFGFCLPFYYLGCHETSANQSDLKQPNILFISIDDLNDWTGFMGGHLQAHTPNLDAFARESMTFKNNYCTSPGCNPSRSTLMTGLHTYTSGMYSNYQDWRDVPKMAQVKTLGHFSKGTRILFCRCWQDIPLLAS